MFLIFGFLAVPENIFTPKISRFTVCACENNLCLNFVVVGEHKNFFTPKISGLLYAIHWTISILKIAFE